MDRQLAAVAAPALLFWLIFAAAPATYAVRDMRRRGVRLIPSLPRQTRRHDVRRGRMPCWVILATLDEH
jgi:hypothetical protein